MTGNKNGIINVYKEPGYTSFDVCAALRKILETKRIGHTGTLDPDAEGVLPVCVGNATGLVQMLTDHEKEYICTMRLGIETDTYDISGTVTGTGRADTDAAAFSDALFSFLGESEQLPPMYSAIKVGGKRLYELARQGITVERKKRRINIKELELLSADPPDFTFRCVCGPGTYIRSICHDLGKKLGSCGCMVSLKRSRVGDFMIGDAVKLDVIREMAALGDLSFLIPVNEILSLPKVYVREEFDRLLMNGNKLQRDFFVNAGELADYSGEFKVFSSDGEFRAVYRWENEAKNTAVPDRMFL